MKTKKVTIIKWILFGLMLVIDGFIIYQSCLPAGMSGNWSSVAVKTVETITQGNVNSNTVVHNTLTNNDVTLHEALRKIIGHFALFGASGVITYLYFFFLHIFHGFKKYYIHIVLTLVVGVFISSMSELIQFFIPGRSGDFLDILLNLGGYVLLSSMAILFVFLFLFLRRKPSNSVSK